MSPQTSKREENKEAMADVEFLGTSDDFNMFMDGLDSISKKIYKIGLTIFVCGDFNITFQRMIRGNNLMPS
jgi:hypothetical protein